MPGGVLEVQPVIGGGGETIRTGKGGDRNRLSINILVLLGMVMTAYVMTVIKKDRPAKEGESVRMRGDSSSAVQWVINCGGGKVKRDREG